MAREPVGDLDRPRRVDARVRAAAAEGQGDARPALSLADLHLPRRRHPGPQGAGHDRQDLGAGARRPQGARRPPLRPGDRRRAGDRARGRLPADAAHLRQHRPGRADPPAGRDARPLHPRPQADRRSRSSRCPRRCRSTRPPRSSASSPPRSGSGSTGSSATGSTRSASTRPRSSGSPPRRRGRRPAARAACRAALTESRRARAQREQLARLEESCEAPVTTLPFLFAPELGVERDRDARRAGGRADGRRSPSCSRASGSASAPARAGSARRRPSAAIAAGMAARGKQVAVLTIDPAKRLADSLGLPELGNTERRVDPALFAAAGDRDRRRRAVGDDARRQGDLRRGRARARARRGDPRPDPLQPHLPAALDGARRLAGVHGDGEAVRDPRRGPLRPARPRHPADPQRARLPRRPEAADAVHRGPGAAGVHEADRVRDAGLRPRAPR